MRYRNIARVMGYADFHEKRNLSAIDMPKPELFIEGVPPVFPVANAILKSLVDGSILESAIRRVWPDYLLRKVAFPPAAGPPDAGQAPPPTSTDVKYRAIYITVERIIKIGETPGYQACLGQDSKHAPQKDCQLSQRIARRICAWGD